MLLNLLSNAVKFTPNDGSVKVNSRIEEDGCLAIAIADTGIGMDKGGIDKAMSMFGRTDSAVIREAEGTGLDLPLSKGLIEVHGGTIDIESAPGEGTTVTLRFPAERIVPS